MFGSTSFGKTAFASDPSGVTATAYTAVISPSSGAFGSSGVITYTLNGTLGTNVVITPFCSVLYGTVSPTTVTIAAGNTTGTTTYTNGGYVGVNTISSSNNEGLSDPAAVTFTASGSVISPGTITNTSATTTTLSFTATNATPSGTYTVQWFRRVHNVGDYAAIAGATTQTPFVDTGLTPGTAYDYALQYTSVSGQQVIAFALNVSTNASSGLAFQERFQVGLGIGLN